MDLNEKIKKFLVFVGIVILFWYAFIIYLTITEGWLIGVFYLVPVSVILLTLITHEFVVKKFKKVESI